LGAQDKFLRNDINNFIFDLETRFETWRTRNPITLEDHLTKVNAQGYQAVFSKLEKFCAAPGCGYPLRYADNFQILNLGEVCYLCYCMHKIVNQKPYFVNAQREYEENKRKKRDSGLFGRP
jgi:hypothetical protein